MTIPLPPLPVPLWWVKTDPTSEQHIRDYVRAGQRLALEAAANICMGWTYAESADRAIRVLMKEIE